MLVIAVGFWFVQGHRSYLQTDTATFGVVNGQHDVLLRVCNVRTCLGLDPPAVEILHVHGLPLDTLSQAHG